MDKLYVTVKEQFPQFVQAEYPAFIAFVQAYYKWLEEEYSIDKIENVVDIDKTANEFVRNFKNQLDVYGIYSDALPFDIKYIKTIREIYEAKGSEQALVFLIKAIYNGSSNDTRIVYPRDSILRASDGVWEQERFITVTKSFGTLPIELNTLILEQNGREQSIDISRFTVIDADTTRFYYKTNIRLSFDVGTNVKIVSNSTVLYRGSIILSPNLVKIIDGGINWQLGQVFKFPGSIADTLCRVTKVDDNGTIERLEVVEYGYDHTPNETIVVSPYSMKPAVTIYDYDYNPLTSTHTITILDYTDGISESVIGANADTSPFSYFLENYASQDYVARKVIDVSNQIAPPVMLDNAASSITITQWLQSRAKLEYSFDKVTATRGKWISNKGILSDSFTKLHDNDYYQQYSYLIESDVLLSKYKTLLGSVHVAGTKAFATYVTSKFLIVDVDVLTTIPFKYVAVSDETDVSDSVIKSTSKRLIDTSLVTDSDDITFTKALIDAATSADAAAVKQLTKAREDTATVTDDTVNFNVVKSLLDTPTLSDDLNINFTRVSVDQVITSDPLAKDVDKPLIDAATSADAAAVKQLTKVAEDSTLATDNNVDFNATKALLDTPTSSDNLSLNFTRVNVDEVIPTDILANDLNKPLADSFTSTDAAAVKELTKVAEDTTTVTDDTVDFNATKSLLDTPTSTDNLNINLTRNVVDEVIPADILVNNLNISLIDAATSADAAAVKQLIKVAEDITDVADDTVDFNATKALLDTPTLSDNLNINLTRNVVDEVILADNLTDVTDKSLMLVDSSTADDITDAIVTKQLIELISSTDNLIKQASKIVLDTAEAYQVETSTNYTTESYFAEEYVESTDPTSLQAELS